MAAFGTTGTDSSLWLSQQFPCESGDSALVSRTRDSILISIDDVDETLPDAAGRSTVPTIRLTLSEARSIARFLEWALQPPPADDSISVS